MPNFSRLIVVVIALFVTTGCTKKLDDATLPANIKIGDVYYTQVSLQYEKGQHVTTNYRRGLLLPINSQVILKDITNKTIVVDVLPVHFELVIKNAPKHTGDNTTQAFAKLFAKNKVNLSGYSELEREKIKAGQVAKGMQKKAVIAAIGYPPQTETPNLQVNQWTYWSSRFDRFIVYFENDHVTRIQD
ncbi:MAG: hypothetical protein PHD43_05555 [Methylococcales bacterium]|nr:hypothetical protein [Methylococcales bacterium]